MTTDAGRSFLDAVLSRPEDDKPRLVYADWLTEAGDARGEFIQLQCTLGDGLYSRGKHQRYVPTGPFITLVKAERRLLKAHQPKWLAPFRKPIRTWDWTRGFVSGVVADAAAFVAGGETIFRHTPLTDLSLTALTPALFRVLSEQETCLKLNSLTVNSQRIVGEVAKEFKSPHWANLRTLGLGANELGRAGLVHVCESKSLSQLTDLDLHNGELTDDEIEELCAAPFFPKLQKLNLGYNPKLTNKTCEHIAKRGRALIEVNLVHNEIKHAGLELLLEAANLKLLSDIESQELTKSQEKRLLERKKPQT
jgi:uncharacterized protein (TIGR02996 family)